MWTDPAAIAAALSGLISGIVYRSDVLPFKKWRFPLIMRKFAKHRLLPWLDFVPIRPTTASINVPIGGGGTDGGSSNPASMPQNAPASTRNNSNTNNQPPVDIYISEEHIVSLVGMGFERDQAVNALRISGNDPNRAAMVLLGG